MEKISGWTADHNLFSSSAVNVFDVAIGHRRIGIVLGDDAIRGERFNNDRAILARLESHFTESEFMACPGTRIDAALVDAAQADYWYSYEKCYEDSYGETEIDGEEDDE